jgi:hypothetical protein
MLGVWFLVLGLVYQTAYDGRSGVSLIDISIFDVLYLISTSYHPGMS